MCKWHVGRVLWQHVCVPTVCKDDKYERGPNAEVSTDPVYLENTAHAEGLAVVLDCLVLKYAVYAANVISYNRGTLQYHNPVSVSPHCWLSVNAPKQSRPLDGAASLRSSHEYNLSWKFERCKVTKCSVFELKVGA